ncbi:MAG: peptidylprolyl isomerase [Gemmatimonadales bacterium]
MRRIIGTALVLLVVGCASEKPIGGHDAVASAGSQQLSVDRLASIMATGGNVPLAREFAERLAHLWVEFTLFAERASAGDSLLDSAIVLRAMWPEVNQAVVDAFHRTIIISSVAVDPSAVDSAYRAGTHRLIKHVLIAVRPDMTPDERAQTRRKAEAMHARLVAGGSWGAANEHNEDPAARAMDGSLGVIARGRMVTEFEDVAFALAPGELSRVAETAFGFHVVFRPSLDEVRTEYTVAVERIETARASDAYLDELVQAWNVRVLPRAPSLMREAAGAPLRARSSDEVIGSHREGKFSVADFVRWLQVLPLQMQQRVATADDGALNEMARSMIRNEALVREARANGIELESAVFEDVRTRLSAEIAVVKSALALDSFQEPAGITAERYVRQLVGDLESSVVVPVFLAGALRNQGDWMVYEPALESVIDRARVIQMQMAVSPGQETVTPASDTNR